MALLGCAELNERYQNAPHWIIKDMNKAHQPADYGLRLMSAIEDILENGCFCPSCLLTALGEDE